MKNMGKIIITIVVLLLLSLPLACMSLLTDSYGTSKESESIKYPSDVIHGFIEGCYLAFEDQRFMSDGLWPTDLKEICGCVMDGIREAVPLHDFIKDWNGKLTKEQESMANMFGMICTEQIIKERLKNQKDPA
tara:strand:+ start:662 stop:1060 length:399 start_codon:yes stop_codon:yes gene_type:complete